MIIGVPREIKNNEFRVGLVPAAVRELVAGGHQVLVETNAGLAIGFSDADYHRAGAEVCQAPSEIFSRAELIVKVKEPQAGECDLLRENQALFTYLHLAPDPALTKRLMDAGTTCIAYETVTDRHGALPLLAPMSEVAGRMAVQVGAYHLELSQGGSGVLLGGVAGVLPGQVVIIGGGVVGTNAAIIAMGMGARVTIIDISLTRLRELEARFGSNQIDTLYLTETVLEQCLGEADLVVGAVLVPGDEAPRIVRREHLGLMSAGSVLVDVAIDQGGCFETSRPTTHARPTFKVDGIIHYCVANIPGAVARTATQALNNATLPYVQMLAEQGVDAAIRSESGLRAGVNLYAGHVAHAAVAHATGFEHRPID